MQKIEKLTQISREKSIFFENYINWDDYKNIQIKNNYFLDEKLISIFWSEIYDKLSEEQKKELSLLEFCQNIYLYSYWESIMCVFMSKFLLNFDIWSPYYNFILREQIEEYRHQEMFEKTLKILSNKQIKIPSFWKNIWTFCTYLPINYFLLLQLSIEIISWDFWRKNIENKEIHSLVRKICEIHEIEESRHIEFVLHYLDENFSWANIFSRTFWWIIIILNIFFINNYYFSKNHYEKVWIKDIKWAYKYAKTNWKKNKYKNIWSKRWLDFLNHYKLITPLNKCIFKLIWIYS